MTFSEMMNDTVSLLKPDGTRFDNIKASVQSKMIFVDDATVPIEEGDIFERVRSQNGITERFRVVDAGYHELGGIESHYQTKVQKISNNEAATDKTKLIRKTDQIALSKVFIVHGHDDEMKHAVARVISQVGLEPIILHEKPNQGKTIIEKFERESDVGFAVVLLSPDDMAYSASSTFETSKPRARQNVVLELGYFVGKLGRDHVMALKRGDELEVPTDLSGVAYTKYDHAGNWRFELVRELKSIGYEVDANAII
jgi:predicted nucleotide-binding protein